MIKGRFFCWTPIASSPLLGPIPPAQGREVSALATLDPRSARLLTAIERRFGLALQPLLRETLVKEAACVVAEGLATSVEEVVTKVTTAGDDHPIVQRLRAGVSIGETSFLRGRGQLSALVDVIRSSLLSDQRRKFLRVWSAACSTGEEPYSLAIVLRNAFPTLRFVVNATDMNPASLEAARLARYGASSFREVPPEELVPHVLPDRGQWLVSPEIHSVVRFSRLNLVTDAFPAQGLEIYGFDVVVCRNVLIYLEPRRIGAVMRKVAKASASHSVLALTPHEIQAGRFLEGYQSMPSALFLRKAEPRFEGTSPSGLRRRVARDVPPTPPVPPPAPVARDPAPLPSLEQARADADAGRLGEAEAVVNRHLAEQPDSAAAYAILGMIRQARGDDPGATEAFRRAIFLDRSSVGAELGLALALGGKNSPEAAAHFRRVVRMLASTPDATLLEPQRITAALARRYAEQGLARGGPP
jgi:chemotaxis protein methyltransferase CheR